MRFTKFLIAAWCLFGLNQLAQAQRQLLCEDDQQCAITCFQNGMDGADKVFHRENIDTLQVDISARVLKIELRKVPKEGKAFDYFILGSEMSCTIENMRGVRD
jgi:hypothetical protein